MSCAMADVISAQKIANNIAIVAVVFMVSLLLFSYGANEILGLTPASAALFRRQLEALVMWLYAYDGKVSIIGIL